MDSSLKQRLIGAAVLAALAVIFLPMLLQGPDVKEPDAAKVSLDLPASPDGEFETRELPLTAPKAGAPEGGVLGMPGADAVDALEGEATAPETVFDTPAGSETPAPSPLAPVPAPTTAQPEPAKPAEPNLAAQAGGNYVVSVGSFANLDNANALVARLRAQRLPVIADKLVVGGKATMRVRVGPYADRALAEIARVRSEAVAGGALKVVTLDAATAPTAAPVATAAASAPATKPAMGQSVSGSKPVPATTVPPTPAATAKPIAAPSPTGFAVQLAAPANEKEALALRDKARAAGFVSFVQKVETPDGARYRVRLGPENDRPAAEKLRDGAAQKLAITGIIVRHP